MKSVLSLDDFLKQAGMLTSEDEETMMIEEPALMDVPVDAIELAVDMPSDDDSESGSEDHDDDDHDDDHDDEDHEEEDEHEHDEEEEAESAGEMAYGQLERCIDYSKMLRQRIKPGDEIEPWIAAKITKSMDYLQSVFNYLDGKDGEEEEEEGEN